MIGMGININKDRGTILVVFILLFVLVIYLFFLNILTINKLDVNKKISIVSQKSALAYTNLSGTYSLLEDQGIVILGYDKNTGQWGSAKAEYILNGYPFIYVPEHVPMKVYLFFEVTSPLHSNKENSTVIIKIENYTINIPLSREKIGTPIKTFIPPHEYLDNNENLKVEIPRKIISDGDVKISIQVPDKTGISFRMVKLVGELPNKPDFVNINEILLYVFIFIFIIFVVFFILLREIIKLDIGIKKLLIISTFIGVIISSISHDIWDFVRWEKIAYYKFIFNAINPAVWWADNPVWPYVVSIFSSPYFLLWKFFTSYVSPILLIFFIKIPILISYISIAIIIEKLLKKVFNKSLEDIKPVIYLWLFNPFILWQLMWGQRDLIAVAMALVGLYLILRDRIVIGSLFIVIGATIKSYVLLWGIVIFLYLFFKKRYDKIRKYLISWILYPLTWLLIPQDLILDILFYRAGEDTKHAMIQGYTWMFSLSRFVSVNNNIMYLFPVGVLLGLLIIGLKLFYNSANSINVLKGISVISVIFYLTYYSVNPQFLILLLPALLILDYRLGIIYSIFGILYAYAHFQDYHIFISPLILPRKGYVFLSGSSMDIALSLIFSLFLLFVLLRVLKEDYQPLNIRFDWIYATGFISVFFLPYCIEVGKNVGIITLAAIILYLCVWLLIFEEKFKRHIYRTPMLTSTSHQITYSQVISLLYIIYIINAILWSLVIMEGTNYFNHERLLLFSLMILLNLAIFINNKNEISIFSPLLNIFVALTYGFKSVPGPLFMNLIYPPKDILLIISVIIAVNILLWLAVIVQNTTSKYDQKRSVKNHE